MSEATQRCIRCGNENSADSYACSFCGKRLRIERIENLFLFKRHEEEWINPLPWYTKIVYLFINPSKAFWDINHKRENAPGMKILLLNALLFGLMGLAFFVHFQTATYNPFSAWSFFYSLSVFVAFFIFGLVFYLIFFAILIWIFTKGANYAVNFSERLETRFGEEEEGTYKQEDLSPFSIYKGGTLLQKQESHKFKMLLCAFAPFLLINIIKILIILVGLPYISVTTTSVGEEGFTTMFNSPVWAVLDVLDAITIAVWVPILMSIAIRELSNSSTIRVLVSSLIIGVFVSIFFYFLRPTLFGGLTVAASA